MREFKELGRKRAKCEYTTDEPRSVRRWIKFLLEEKIRYCLVADKKDGKWTYRIRVYGGQLITEKLIGFYVNEYWNHYRKELESMET